MRRGPLYMVAAGLALSLMVWMVREVRTELSALEVIWWRALVGIPIALALVRPVGVRLHARRVFVLRVVFGMAAMICYYHAARGLLVADLSILSKLQPIVVAFLAPLVLGARERPGLFVWLLLLAGLSGCAILLAPDLEVGNTYGLWALAGALVSAAAHVTVRSLGSTDDPRILVLWFHVALLVVSGAVLLAGPGAPAALPDTALLPWLLGIGVTGLAGQLLMTWAYKLDRAPVVAAASYSAPLFALSIDFLALGVPPGGDVLAGGGIVVAAGLVLILRQRSPDPETV